MPTTHLHTCSLCEATCGVVVTVDGDQVVSIRGDKDDPMSKGYLCAKGPALADIHHDPDRLRRPLVKAGDGWREASWDEAFDLVASKLRAIRAEHGNDAVAIYQGNPSAHNLGILAYGQLLWRAFRTKNRYSATSVDQLNHMLAGYLMFGHQLVIPIPDIDHTDLFICFGANPAASNGSLMTAPNVRGKLKAIQERGGRVVVIDPRRTETVAVATEHHFIRPGTDALLMLAMVNVLFDEGLVRTTRPALGLDALRDAAKPFTPEATSVATGVEPDVVRDLARSLASTPRAVVYGRVGVSTQEFGGLCAWLLNVLNALTGHLDERGGAMFPLPAVDLVSLTGRAKESGSFDTFRSRGRGLPEFGGELPVAELAAEMEAPGSRQIRAFVCAAGNPVLSTPNGRRLERALAGLDFMVSIDMYLNETSRFADVILPPAAHLERPHYDLLFPLFGVRNGARYVPAVFERDAEQRHDWEICLELLTRTFPPKAVRGPMRWLLGARGPEGMINLAMRMGPQKGMSLKKLRRNPSGIDLGPLQPQLPKRLFNKSKAVELAPEQFLADLPRLQERWAGGAGDGTLVLIGRRHIRSNNSWMHNSERLMTGGDRCTLLVHPSDAATRGLVHGHRATVTSPAGSVDVPVEVSDTVMPGVVCMPHGYGHGRPGVQLSVAAAHPGASFNDVADEQFVDQLTGTTALNGVPVLVSAVVPAGVD